MSIDDLLTAALTRGMDEDAERMRKLATEAAADATGRAGSLRTCAGLMAAVFGDRARLLAEYELYLLAARDPRLRVAAGRWLDALADFGRRHTDDPVRVQILVATVDGVPLQGLPREQQPTTMRV